MAKEASAMALCEADGRVVACDASFAALLGEARVAGAAGLPEIAAHPAGGELWRHCAAFLAAGRDEARLALDWGGRERRVRLRRMTAADGPRVLIEFADAEAEREAEMNILRLLHDFKNQLGGMKLYAAFIKRRLAGDAEGVEACEKLTAGLNAMAERAKLVGRRETST
jgi:PAS domain-containing protein